MRVDHSARDSKLSVNSSACWPALQLVRDPNRVMVVLIHVGNDSLSRGLIFRCLIVHCDKDQRTAYTDR